MLRLAAVPPIAAAALVFSEFSPLYHPAIFATLGAAAVAVAAWAFYHEVRH